MLLKTCIKINQFVFNKYRTFFLLIFVLTEDLQFITVGG